MRILKISGLVLGLCVSFTANSAFSQDAATKGNADKAGAAKTMYLTASVYKGDHNCDEASANCCASGYHMCDAMEIYGKRIETAIDKRLTCPGGGLGWVDSKDEAHRKSYPNCNDWASPAPDVSGAYRGMYDTGINLWVLQTYGESACDNKISVWCCRD